MVSKMKESGAEWIGLVPTSWQIGRIGSLYTLRNEKVSDRDFAPLSVTMQGIVPQLSTAAKTDDHDSRKLVKKGDFAINSRSDRRGSCGISEYDGSVSLINTVLTPRGEMVPRYYNWLFHTVQFADEFYKNGHGIVDDLWTTRWDEMKRILIPVPSVNEQTVIATFLDKKVAHIDSLITEAKVSIEEYKQWKASIIYEAVTKGLGPNVEMKDSGVEWIGEIPSNWNVVKGHRIISATQNGITRRDLEKSEGSIVLKLKNITADGKISYDYINRIELTSQEVGTYQLLPGDFLFVRVNGSRRLVGKCAIYEDNGEITAFNDHIIRVRFNGLCYPKYIQYYLLSDSGKREIELHTSTSAGQFTISGEGLRDIVYILPNHQEQKSIVEYIDKHCGSIDAIISEKESLISDLEAYKKSLIFEVVTGKRKVV